MVEDYKSMYYAKFLKITAKKYAQNLMNGQLYCNSLHYFRDNGNAGQKDENEGVAYYYPDYNQKNCIQKIDFEEKDVYIFCLYLLYAGEEFELNGKKFLHYKMPDDDKQEFKKFFASDESISSITIEKVDEFISQVEKFCKKNNISYIHSDVKYYDLKNPDEEMNEILKEYPLSAIFVKPKQYAEQKEYRFAFWDGDIENFQNEDGAVVLPIGNMDKIAKLCDDILL